MTRMDLATLALNALLLGWAFAKGGRNERERRSLVELSAALQTEAAVLREFRRTLATCSEMVRLMDGLERHASPETVAELRRKCATLLPS